MRHAYLLVLLLSGPVLAEDCASMPSDAMLQCVIRAIDKWADANYAYEIAKANREAIQMQLEAIPRTPTTPKPPPTFTNCLRAPGGYNCVTY